MRQRHHMTVDVEEYFHPTALEGIILRSEWPDLPRRSRHLVSLILDRFSAASVRGTFFVLGWLAEKEAEMVRSISDAGHEVASHGWDHRRVTDLSPEEFREDIRRSRNVLQEVSGQAVIGYRAPSFSILPGFEWALDILLAEGFEYDSSMFPIRLHPGYGYPEAPPDPHGLERPGGTLWEIPPTTLELGRLRLPAAGGAYLRFFPSFLVAKGLAEAEKRGFPGTVYFHPWETDPEMPRVRAPALTRLRMRHGIRPMLRRLETLTARFAFRPIRETVADLKAQPSPPTP